MAKEKRNFVVSVLSEHETLYYGDCTALTVPTGTDVITILPHHTPLIAKLGKGQVTVYNGHVKQLQSEVEGGLLYVGDNESTILINL
jgi:F0F1-type ATP synthase epsilon subunit